MATTSRPEDTAAATAFALGATVPAYTYGSTAASALASTKIGGALAAAGETIGPGTGATATVGNPLAIIPALVAYNGAKRADAATDAAYAYGRAQALMRKTGIENVSVKDILSDMLQRGTISATEYKKSISLIDSAIRAYDDGFLTDKGNKNIVNDWGYTWAHMGKTHREMEELLNKIADYIPTYGTILKQLSKEGGEGLGALVEVPAVASAPEPEYLDTNFKGTQLPVEPVHWWSGQELADLHNINYDPNSYYDLIKQGTEADVAYNQYLSDQMNDATMVDDTQNVTSYLDSIRNNKAEAIATGATMGARAANELLSNANTFADYATKQADSFTNRFNTTNKSINADARAMSTAQDYFVNLAKALADDSMGLYYNDSQRYAQELLSNADMYAADQNLRGIRSYINGSMAGNYEQAKANINQAQQGMNDIANEYKWIFNNYKTANDDNVLKAFFDTNDYINYNYNKNNNYTDYINSIVKK